MSNFFLDSIKSKLRDANKKNYETKSKLQEMNKKIHDFNCNWNGYKQNSFSTILRSIVDAFYENVYQYKDIFKEILSFNMPEMLQLRTKKSIIFESNSPGEGPNRSSLKRKATIFDSNPEIENLPFERKLNRKSTLFYEKYENYQQFEIHLKNKMKLNLEDEHLKYLSEQEITQTFKSVHFEMNKIYEDYKNKLLDTLKNYKEIKEDYLTDVIEAKETYIHLLQEFLYNKFNKNIQKKNDKKTVPPYLEIFETIIIKLRIYCDNLKSYSNGLRALTNELNDIIKNSESQKKEILNSCSELMKDFDKFLKNMIKFTEKSDSNNGKKGQDASNQELNDECIIKKNHVFKKLDTEFCIIQEAIDLHSDKISEIKYNYFINTLNFIVKQTQNIDELVEEVDEKIARMISNEDEYRNFDEENLDEEGKNDATFDENEEEPNTLEKILDFDSQENEENNEKEENLINPDQPESISKIASRGAGIFLTKMFKSFFAEWFQNPFFYVRKLTIFKKFNFFLKKVSS